MKLPFLPAWTTGWRVHLKWLIPGPRHPAPALGAALALALVLVAALHLVLPEPLFRPVYSTVVLDRAGALLGATVAPDGQWRFPPERRVSSKFTTALLRYEDRRFWQHGGVDPLALVRAARSNLAAGAVSSGGSTITMQLMRLSRGNPERTLGEKLVEAAMALVCEVLNDKASILALYAAHAPFGGNVVGLEAAAWRYFGRAADQLSWAEAATLAVLPNSPGLIHPGRNRQALQAKRDALLASLWRSGAMDLTDYRLALAEALPGQTHDLPRIAPFYVERIRQTRLAERQTNASPYRSSLDRGLQVQVNALLERHVARLRSNGINHAAVLVLDVPSAQVLAYAGNLLPPAAAEGARAGSGDWSDMVFAARSTGSLLKPFLYAAQQEAGELLPAQLVADIPTRFTGFVPENNTRSYSGAVPADQALARSLNVPAVRNLRSFGLHRFYDLLKTLGLGSLFRPADLYGLPLVIGGAEGTLWDLAHMYADLGRQLLPQSGQGAWGNWPLPGSLRERDSGDATAYPFSAGAVWLTVKALSQVQRPEEEGAWDSFLSSRLLAWKTGTSYGYRDAWAIGFNRRYTIAVWAGNASGESRPELRGYAVAAPILFSVLSTLPEGGWFEAPADLVAVETCADSGYLAGPDCVHRVRTMVSARGAASQICPYCRVVHLDKGRKWQVDAGRVPVADIISEKRFVLPPHLEWYYRRANATYQALPPFMPGSAQPGIADGLLDTTNSGELAFSLLQPESGARIYVPVDIDGQPGMTVFQAAARSAQATLHWHLDGQYLGSTREIHQMEARPGPGIHRLALVDQDGRRIERSFEVLSKK